MTNSANRGQKTHKHKNIVFLTDQPNPRHPGYSANKPTAATRTVLQQVNFDRRELNEILRVYGFKVAAGEWRDYAIDHLTERAVFSIFRNASEVPLFQIEKNPKLANRQGMYSVTGVAGQVLKRGTDLRQVLKIFEKKPKLRVI